MKIQSLAIIFIIIILPISMVLSEYTKFQTKTLNLQSTYDSKLITATYDAVKAFKINTVNSSTSDISASKVRDIEASANTFFASVARNFGLSGYNADLVKDYVPAIVFTLYDGYYIYSPFNNTLTDIEQTDTSTSSANNTEIYGTKSYVYYSCKYRNCPKTGDDFTITYTLDNYITIQGIVNGNYINESGYFINPDAVKEDPSGNIIYRGIVINIEDPLIENIYDGTDVKPYKYIKENGVKYYWDENEDERKAFTMLNGERYIDNNHQEYNFGNNTKAIDYYKKAKKFSDKVYDLGLNELKFEDAYDVNGTKITGRAGFDSNVKIFEGDPELSDSNFNEHRLAVIRYAIEQNLQLAISNYNEIFSKADFQMPSLSETDWYKLLNNISVMSFVQGMQIGGKMYNGYAVVTNNQNEEYIDKDLIYIKVGNYYHKVNDKALLDLNINDGQGFLNIDFERKNGGTNDDGNTIYYYPQTESACYNCIVNRNNNDTTYENNFEYVINLGKEQPTGQPTEKEKMLQKLYYTALGRERESAYKLNNAMT